MENQHKQKLFGDMSHEEIAGEVAKMTGEERYFSVFLGACKIFDMHAKTEEDRLKMRKEILGEFQKLFKTFRISSKDLKEFVPKLAQDLACGPECVECMIWSLLCEEDSLSEVD